MSMLEMESSLRRKELELSSMMDEAFSMSESADQYLSKSNKFKKLRCICKKFVNSLHAEEQHYLQS
jgi:hypothetical protein